MVRESNWSDWSSRRSDRSQADAENLSRFDLDMHLDREVSLDLNCDRPLPIPTPAKMQEIASIIRESWSLAERQRRALIAFYVLWRERLAMARANSAMDHELRRVRPNFPSVRWPQLPQ